MLVFANKSFDWSVFFHLGLEDKAKVCNWKYQTRNTHLNVVFTEGIVKIQGVNEVDNCIRRHASSPEPCTIQFYFISHSLVRLCFHLLQKNNLRLKQAL